MAAARARRTPCASLVFSLAAAIVFLLPSLAEHLQYDRAALAAGESWRLLTGHWVHYSLDHFTWDVLAFLALGAACERTGRGRLVGCVLASPLAISAAVWFWLPGLDIYRGLSGVDSALFGLLFANLWFEDGRSRQRDLRWIAAALFVGFVLKVSFEVVTGGTVFVKDMAAGSIAVPLAHIVGAGVGLLAGLSGCRATGRLAHGVAAHPTPSPQVEVC
jgi:rhomboid family GlyGly-CTERM serine protease